MNNFVLFTLAVVQLQLISAVPLLEEPIHQNAILTDEDFENGRRLLESKEPAGPGFDYSKEVVLRRHDTLRNAQRFKRWAGGVVPYEISSLYTTAERAVVTAAIQEYQSKTCVRFVARTTQTDYIHITPDDGMGSKISPYCYSDVGRMSGRQFVKMYGECVRLPAMIHELGHAIGFEHEHNRVDRDYYIDVQWTNIDPVYYYAFDKVSATNYDTLGLTYDYYSIMHYPDYSFAKSGLKAFKLKYPGNVSNENQRLSPTDVLKFNKYFGCS